MAPRRERRGFLPAGDVSLDAGAMPARRARELRLARAWADAAGEAVARHARALRVRRDVLEIAVDDPGWARALSTMLPVIAARMAAASPELGVRRLRVFVDGAPPTPAPAAVEIASGAVSKPGVPGRAPRPGTAATGPPAIEELARRYLERSRGGKR